MGTLPLFNCVIKGDDRLSVKCAGVKIDRIVINLISNTVKLTLSGSTDMSVKTSSSKLVQRRPHPEGQMAKVLVIEDDCVAKRVVKLMLTRAGFDVEDVEDAEVGFRQVKKNSYDFILTDIGLPGMSGNEFTLRVRAWEKATNLKPMLIVGLTAHGPNLQAAAEEAGMDLLLSKPLNAEKLKVINDRLLTNKAHATPSGEQASPADQSFGLGHGLPETEEALFEIDRFPLLDEKDGIEASGGSFELLQELLCLLVNETLPEELPLLIEAHNKNDWGSVQSIAHKIKGGALYCGTRRLRYACQYTERYRLAGHKKLLEPLYQQLLVVIDETMDSLRNVL